MLVAEIVKLLTRRTISTSSKIASTKMFKFLTIGNVELLTLTTTLISIIVTSLISETTKVTLPFTEIF